MSDIERLDQRLTAVERALVDGDFALDELSDLAAVVERLERLESRVEEHERRLGTLQGKTQSIEGYVGNVRAVNDDVEQQANAAIAAVDRMERRLDALDRRLSTLDGGDGIRPEANAVPNDSSGESRAPEGVSRGDEPDRTSARHDSAPTTGECKYDPTTGTGSATASDPSASSTSFDGPPVDPVDDSADARVEDTVDELLATSGDGPESDDDASGHRAAGEGGESLAAAAGGSGAAQHDVENRLSEPGSGTRRERDTAESDAGAEESPGVLRSVLSRIS